MCKYVNKRDASFVVNNEAVNNEMVEGLKTNFYDSDDRARETKKKKTKRSQGNKKLYKNFVDIWKL